MNVSNPAAPELPESREFTLFDLLLLLKKNSRRLLLNTVGVGVLAFGATYLIAPRFTASVKFLPPAQQQGLAGLLGESALGGLASVAGGLGLKSTGEQWVGMLKSRAVEDNLIRRFDLEHRYRQQFMFKTRAKLEARTDVALGKDGIITIEVDDEDPTIAAHLADGYVEELQKLSNGLAIGEAAQRRVFFERELKQANETLLKAETALRTGGINESLLKASPETAADIVAQLKAQETAAQIRLDVLRSRVTQNSPEWRDAEQALSGLREQLAAANKASSSGNDGQGSGADYVRRYRDFKYAEALFELMAKQYELAKADEAREGSLIQVIDPAVVPEWKSSPKRLVIAAVAALFALALTIIRLLVKQAVNDARATRPSLATTLGALRATRWFR
jgi:uncharacterized protein involved in exopolysaccharide biosynthesis